MDLQEQEKLLDDGWMLIQAHSSLGNMRNESNTGCIAVWRPQIRAKYGQRRRWYVLEKGFPTNQDRDNRIAELVKLPKYILHSYASQA